MSLVDLDFEDRLIDRIAAREIITAAALPLRHRRILRARLYDFTLREIAADEAISTERVRQICNRAFARLRQVANRQPRRPSRHPSPPPGFDKAAFLKHMQYLIALREQRDQEIFELEHTALLNLVAKEHAPSKPQPSFTFPVQPLVLLSVPPVFQPLDERTVWLTLLRGAATECSDPRYRHLLPDIERDIAKLVACPPGPLPWQLDRHHFFTTWNAKKQQAREAYQPPQDDPLA